MSYKQSSNCESFPSYMTAKNFLNKIETGKRGSGRIDKKSNSKWIVRYWL